MQFILDLDYLKNIWLCSRIQVTYSYPLIRDKKENEDCYKNYKMSPTELFDKAGIFKNRTIAAHGVYLSDNDLDIIKENNVSIVHNPSSNLKLSSGF